MRSLRKTLILGTTVGTAAVLLIIGILLYMLARAGLIEQFDASLIDKARLLASTVELEDDEIDLQFSEFDMHEFEKHDRPGYLQLWLADGSVLFRSTSLKERDLERFAGVTESPVCRRVKLPYGRGGRAVGIAFAPKIENERNTRKGDSRESREDPRRRITLVLARGTTSIDQTLARLEMLLVLAGTLAIAISGAVLWFVIRGALRPLNELAEEISRLDEEDLSAKVSAGSSVQELQPVTERLNDLLGRLGAAFERERSFSADVAHELRTPLSGLRSTMEVILSKPRETAEYREALGDSLQITTQMQAMVENLLTLARLEAGETEVKREQVVLNELLKDAFKPVSDVAKARELQLEWSLEAQRPVLTDRSLLGLAIRNILENAVAYANDGGTIKVTACVRDDAAEIHVSNSGSTLSQEQAEQAFERFWRGDTARSATGVHCGLGLSLVKKIVTVLGGSAGVQSSKGGYFKVTVSIPAQ